MTVEELKTGRTTIDDLHAATFGGLLISSDYWGPIAMLAITREPTLRGRLEHLARQSKGVYTPVLCEIEGMLSLNQRNAIAHATFDWCEWTMYHGLGPGIMTALQNGQKDEVLAAIDNDLKKAEMVTLKQYFTPCPKCGATVGAFGCGWCGVVEKREGER